METIARFGTTEQKERWLKPLLEGQIRSCFAMTEPDVASSDATNISVDIASAGDEYIVNGRKWWCTGAGSLHTQVMILMGKTSPDHPRVYEQQSMLLVPMATPGIRLVRPLTVFGDEDAPKGHMEIVFEDVRVPKASLLWGEGKGFEIAQRRLGPGRIHHCMRAIGQAERALSLMCARAEARVAFGKPLAKRDTVLDTIARSRAEIDGARHLVREAAALMDSKGNTDPHTRQLLSLVKALVPQTVQTIADRAMQVHGAAGLSSDTPLATIWASARLLRLADGPDEVHWRKAGQIELGRQQGSRLRGLGLYTPARDETEPLFRHTTDPISAEATAKLAAFDALMAA
jgi:alkylation response protein AidB-like acyl-CoA dehydrogenase